MSVLIWPTVHIQQVILLRNKLTVLTEDPSHLYSIFSSKVGRIMGEILLPGCLSTRHIATDIINIDHGHLGRSVNYEPRSMYGATSALVRLSVLYGMQ